MLDSLMKNVTEQVGTYLPSVLSAVAVLVIGWILAHLIARVVRMALKKTGLGDKLGGWISKDGSFDASKIIAKVVFYIIMLFVIITFFNVLNLPVVSKPLDAFLAQIFEYAPRVFSAGILGLIAYVLARVVREVSKKGLEAADIDGRIASFGSDAKSVVSSVSQMADKGLEVAEDDFDGDELNFGESDDFGEEISIDDGNSMAASPAPAQPAVAASEDESVKLSQTLPEAVYWIIIALFLPAILGALQMNGLLEPVQKLFNKAFDYLPNVIGAAVILLVGVFVARIVKQVASNLAASLGVNQLANKFGLGNALSNRKISDVLGVVVYALILLPVVVAALNTLSIDAVTKPASGVLEKLTSLIPGFLGAGVVLGLAYFIGKVVADIVEDLLAGVGFDGLPAKMGLKLSNTSETMSLSKIASKLILVSIIILSAMQALPMMGLESFAGHLETFVGFATQVLLGLVILALGMYIANFVAKLVKDSGIENASKLAMVARVAILVFAGGFAFQQMGLSASIVNVAFGSILGGLGLATAIAFGWGGRDAAKRVLDRVVK
jgi:hypothetical protein